MKREKDAGQENTDEFTMFAVIKTGGKQYRVNENDVIVAERLEGEVGDSVDLDVLMSGDGADVKSGGSVNAEIIEQRKGDKITVFKKRRRSTYRRTKGHRQFETVLRVIGIGGSKAKAKPAAKKADEKPAAKDAPKKAAPKKEAAPKKDEAKKADAPAKKTAAKKGVTGKADDLTKLNGVGPAYAKKLNAAGVTTFEQVAAWKKADIEKLDEQISGLQAKAENEGWVAQAKDLAKEN